MRGVIINITAHMRKQWNIKIKDLLEKIHIKETLNKQHSSQLLASELTKYKAELRDALVTKHSHQLFHHKATHYHYLNKAGSYTARKLKPPPPSRRIIQLRHPKSNVPLKNPQDTADSFRAYHSDLYNLKEDPSVLQPSPNTIKEFLDTVKIPTIPDKTLADLSKPFTPTEVMGTIKSLPSKKIPGIWRIWK